MFANGAISPSSLSIKDLPWQVHWDKERCTLCGRCTAVCPVHAIELGVHRQRVIRMPALGEIGQSNDSSSINQVYYGVRQKTDPAYACVGCASCALVCPNDCI